MNLMGLFRSPQNELEKGGKPVPEEDAGIRTACPHCGVQLPLNELQDNLQVCTSCGYHFRMGPRDRISYLVDEDSFAELYGDLKSRDVLSFPGYDQKLRNAKLASREKEGVICGTAQVGGDREPNAWFTGFLQSEENPLAFIVLVENGGSGSRVAGNIAKQVLAAAVGR